jgi:protein TorT
MKNFYLACLLMYSLPMSAADWFPVTVQMDGKTASYRPLTHASKAWRVCALLPQTRDKYWWGVSWGLSSEAERQGIILGIYQAGGYEHLDVSRKQFAHCIELGADAIVLAAISSDGLNEDIAKAAELKIPVIDLVNGVSSTKVAARSLVNFSEMSREAARYLLSHSKKTAIKVAWFPGPKGAAWVTDAEEGVKTAFQNRPVEIIHAGYGATEPNVQMGLVRDLLKKNQKPDFILGNAVAVEMSANYFERYKTQELRQSISFYASEPVINLIRQGRVMAAVSDAPVLQARIAIDLAIRVLENKTYSRHISPLIEVIDANNIAQYDFTKIFPPTEERFGQKELTPK